MDARSGGTYKLTFIDGFTELDGVYTVLSIMSWDEMIIEDVTVEDTYTALNKTADEWVVDKPNYLAYQFLKIRSVNDETIIYYISEKMLAQIPDFSIDKYNKLSLLTNLGTFHDEDEISGIILKVKDILSTNYGITNDPIVVSHGEEWLSVDDYTTIKQERDNNKSTVVNPYTLQQQLTEQLTVALDKVAYLEALLTPPSILTATIDPDGTTLRIVCSKNVIVSGGTFTLHGSVSPTITATYSSGSLTNTIIYTLSPTAQNLETVTMDFTGPGITGPVPNFNIPNTTGVSVDNGSTQ